MKPWRLMVAVVLLTACGGDDDPLAWAGGAWKAVRMNGQALPYGSPPYPYTRSDSLRVTVLYPPIGGVEGAVVFYETIFTSAVSPPTTRVCGDTDVLVHIREDGLETELLAVTTNIGGCPGSVVEFNFTRAGDSLSGTWNGASVRLVQ